MLPNQQAYPDCEIKLGIKDAMFPGKSYDRLNCHISVVVYEYETYNLQSYVGLPHSNQELVETKPVF